MAATVTAGLNGKLTDPLAAVIITSALQASFQFRCRKSTAFLRHRIAYHGK